MTPATGTDEATRTAEATDLLQHLIRNACVNDGTAPSGQEHRNAEVIRQYLGDAGLDLQSYEPEPGRTSLAVRIEGTDPDAPSLTLLGHTDVVPANADDWSHDPFGGDLVDGVVWGRGAIDMLNLTATMAVALKHLAASGFRPRGSLTYIAVADEEGLSRFGAQWLCQHEADDLRTDYVVTETGGFPMEGMDGMRLPVIVGEKGTFWTRMTVKGTPGHGSQPLRTDNALVKAAEIVRRIDEYRPRAQLHEAWRVFVDGMGFPPDLAGPLLDPDGIDDFLDELPLLGLARQAHAVTHTTIAPTIMDAGSKINVIPDRVELQLDIRSLPGWGPTEVRAMLDEIVGPDLADSVEIDFLSAMEATTSPLDSPLRESIERAATVFYPGARTVPYLSVGATDARFTRQLGATSYGFGLHSPAISFEQFGAMFHGIDERVDVESLHLSTEMWMVLARDLVG
jgi:acetylornithine deacetylase/succinyl-diaminopimelate desuccinylase-like protein